MLAALEDLEEKKRKAKLNRVAPAYIIDGYLMDTLNTYIKIDRKTLKAIRDALKGD